MLYTIIHADHGKWGLYAVAGPLQGWSVPHVCDSGWLADRAGQHSVGNGPQVAANGPKIDVKYQ